MPKPAAKPSKRGPQSPLSTDHLSALAEGRRQGAIVRRYLSILPNTTGRPGRKPGPRPGTVKALEAQLATATDPLMRLKLRGQIRRLTDIPTPSHYAKEIDAFISVVAEYSYRFGIAWDDWIAEGVPGPVLRRGGLKNPRVGRPSSS